MKDVKSLSDLLNINNQKKEFDLVLQDIVNFISKEIKIDLNKTDIIINNNIIKIKTNSNKKFVLFLNKDYISKKIQEINKDFILEL